MPDNIDWELTLSPRLEAVSAQLLPNSNNAR
jgi:hypothetical protein